MSVQVQLLTFLSSTYFQVQDIPIEFSCCSSDQTSIHTVDIKFDLYINNQMVDTTISIQSAKFISIWVLYVWLSPHWTETLWINLERPQIGDSRKEIEMLIVSCQYFLDIGNFAVVQSGFIGSDFLRLLMTCLFVTHNTLMLPIIWNEYFYVAILRSCMLGKIWLIKITAFHSVSSHVSNCLNGTAWVLAVLPSNVFEAYQKFRGWHANLSLFAWMVISKEVQWPEVWTPSLHSPVTH